MRHESNMNVAALVRAKDWLPGMDGYEVARAFRADDMLKNTFLVALSGYALPEDLRHAADAGFERHLAKPLHPEKLEQLLADAFCISAREALGHDKVCPSHQDWPTK